MTFQDILKKSFLEEWTLNDLSLATIIIVMGITTLFAAYIYFFYRYANKYNFYSKQLNSSLAILAVITASIILTISSNIVVSLGMVGALSIVRFRTAIKAPMDLVFLFWSISVGIMCGASQFELAIVASMLVTALIIIVEKIPETKKPMLLVIQSKNIEVEEAISKVLKEDAYFYQVKSRMISKGILNLVIEVKVKDGQNLLINVNKIEQIEQVSLMTHEGEMG